MTDTSEIARTLHHADGGERFTMEITAENGERAFRWSGAACEIRAVVELIAARLQVTKFNGIDPGDGVRAEP